MKLGYQIKINKQTTKKINYKKNFITLKYEIILNIKPQVNI